MAKSTKASLDDGSVLDTTPAIDPRAALQKLISGATLTPAEREVLNVTPPATVTPRSAGRVIEDQYAAPSGATPQGPVVSSTGSTGSTGAAQTGSTGSIISTGGTGSFVQQQAPADDSKLTALQAQIASLQAQINSQNQLSAAAKEQAQQNAIQFLTTTFNNLGLTGDIATAVVNLVQKGYNAETIQLIAQDPNSKDPLSTAFQQRFPANAARLKAGMPVLTPAEYLATERSYAQVMQSYGINANFATNKDVFTKLLTNDVSPTELNSRISTAKQVIENTDPMVTQQLQQYYGLSQGDMLAHVLDPAVATPIIEKQIQTAQIGAEAARAGASATQAYAETLAGMGITEAQARQGYQNIAAQQTGMQELASRFQIGGPAGQVGANLAAAQFGTTGSVQAQQALQRLTAQEQSLFQGSSGIGKGSLGTAAAEAAGGIS